MIEYKNKYKKGNLYNLEDFLDLNWQQVVNTPRKELFMAYKEIQYGYGSKFGEKVYTSVPFNFTVYDIMSSLNRAYSTKYNVCFLNYYEDEKNSLGWHSDDSEGMNLDHPIAVVSFGAERYIHYKPIGYKGVIPDRQKVLLEDQSLFIMPKGFQRFFLHKIPRHDRPCGVRVSLTFRNMDYVSDLEIGKFLENKMKYVTD